MIRYTQEFLENVKGDIGPILQEHFREVHPAREVFPLDIDWELYEKLESLGLVKVFTARDGEVLVGYMCVVISPNLHSKGTQTACEDGLFVSKNYRKASVARGLVEFVEKCLREDGFKVFHITGTEEKPIDPLMNRMGYTKIESKFQKVL